MADDKNNTGSRDRSTVSANETYEADYFAEKHGLSRDQVQVLIDRVGNSRAALEAAVASESSTTPKKRGRPAKAAGSSPSESPKRKPPAANSRKTSAKARASGSGGRTAAAGNSVPSGMTDVLQPAANISARAVKRVAAAPRKVARATSDGAALVRKAAKAAPRTAAKRANEGIDGVKSAVSGRTASIVGAAAAGLMTGLVVNLGRKMVVQAPSALAGDWFDALKVEHKLALALFDKLQATNNDNTGKRTALLTQLKHALGKHAFTEENVIYPALRRWGDKTVADKLNHDHGYVKQNLYDLEKMDNASPAFLKKVASFRAEIEEHIREEEDLIFPPMHAALGDAGNAKVTAQANKEGFKLA